MYETRTCRVPEDAAIVAPLLNQTNSEPVSPERLSDNWVRDNPEGGLRFRQVTVDETGRAVGYSVLAHDPWDCAGQFFVRVLADRGARGQGLGSALLEEAESKARRHGATAFASQVRDDDPASLEWAKRRGYGIDRHLFESTLDLATFDESRFAGAIEAVEAQGIRFTTLAGSDWEENAHRLYDMVSHTVFDIPGVDMNAFPPYEEWAKDTLDPALIHRDCHILALEGDRVVGATDIVIMRETGAAYTDLTTVDREFRGRGIALALKLLSVRTARKYGAPYMRTNNDELNAPMLAVNRKLGYVPAPGFWRLKKQIG